jgi:hypothetical protein
VKTKSAAIVKIKRAAHMSPKGRKDIARWLRRQAAFLEGHAKELSDRFTARYIYR